MFRKEALERLASPEQLDQIMETTSTRAWALLAAVGLLLATAVVWSVFGSVPTRVAGRGILVKSGGVLDVVALASGQLTALYVDVGRQVQRGEIVARIAQPELSEQIERQRAKLAELRQQHQRLLQLGTTGDEVRAGYVSQERGSLMISLNAAKERLTAAREREKRQRELFEKGLVTKQSLEGTREEIRAAETAMSQASAQMRGLSVTSHEARGQNEREVLASQLRLSDAEHELALLEERLELTSRVISAHSGRVLEVHAREGDVVVLGRSIFSLEPEGAEGTGIEALIFVPLSKGKMVRPGMRVQIAPDNVRREEHGVMIGILTSVADFPSTEEGMKRVLGNELLVRNLLDTVGLAPIAVRAELVPDARTQTGYRWTSREGPPLQLGPGTPAAATISVRETRPIELVIPLLRAYLGT